MKKGGVFIAGVLLVFVFTTSIAEVSYFWLRGEAWRDFDRPSKLLYVQGVMDGLLFAHGKVGGVEIAYETSIEHLVDSLDQFYSDYLNELIPVPFALKVISLELSGTSKLVVEKELASLRQQFKQSEH